MFGHACLLSLQSSSAGVMWSKSCFIGTFAVVRTAGSGWTEGQCSRSGLAKLLCGACPSVHPVPDVLTITELSLQQLYPHTPNAHQQAYHLLRDADGCTLPICFPAIKAG